MHKIEKYLVTLNKKRRLRKYHKRLNSIAKKALSVVESERGKTNNRLINRCEEYAAEILGWKGYAPWLWVYSAITGEFKAGWIPDNYYGKIVVPKVNGHYRDLSEIKSLSNELIRTDAIPDILRVMNGRFFNNKMEELGRNQIKDYLFNANSKIVFKLDHSIRGRGIWTLDKESFDIQTILSLGNGVFQRLIIQHPFFEKLSPGTVITLRLTTISDIKKGVSARAAYLRVGRKGDNHLKATSNIRIAVDLESGALFKRGFYPDWSTTKKHPDTNENFYDNFIPKFQEAIDVVTGLHKKVPYIMSIGWDVVIDKGDNVLVMEWNADHNDIKFSEALTGPCFTDLGWEHLWRN